MIFAVYTDFRNHMNFFGEYQDLMSASDLFSMRPPNFGNIHYPGSTPNYAIVTTVMAKSYETSAT